MRIHANVLNVTRNVENDFLAVGWSWRNVVPAPPNDIMYDNGESNGLQIMTSVVQIRAKY